MEPSIALGEQGQHGDDEEQGEKQRFQHTEDEQWRLVESRTETKIRNDHQ